MAVNRIQVVGCMLLCCCGVSAQLATTRSAQLATTRSAQPAQDPQGAAAQVADFDRLQTALNNAVQENNAAQADVAAQADIAARLLQLSDAFLQLPPGATRKARLAQGAYATLHAGRTEMALQLATPANGPQRNDLLLTVQLQALARLQRLAEFARIVKHQASTEPAAIAAALQSEEGRLLPLAAKALRTPDRPAGRLIFEHLATLEPILPYRVANLGLCLRQIGDLEAANKTYALGRQLAPDDLELWNDYGLMLRATGRWQEALDALQRSVALDLRREQSLRGQGPAITNLMHAESLRPGTAGADPVPNALFSLERRPHATLLRRLTLDVTLDRLFDSTRAIDGAVVDKANHR